MTYKRRAEECEVMAVPRPKFTSTWRPFDHSTIIEAASNATDRLGLKITQKEYSLNESGNSMFALWQTDREFNGKRECIGFRNSIDKAMSIGFAAFLTVMLCMNQITSGRFIKFRKHTGSLTKWEIDKMAEDSIKLTTQRTTALHNWHENLKNYPVDTLTAEILTVRAMRYGALNPSKFKEFDNLVLNDEAKYNNDLHGFHGGLTQLIREQNFMTIAKKNKTITTFVEHASIQLAHGI